ncbi:hypothetical protein NE582_06105 [Gordonibacter pamelaeae]|uniref:hypothetical protein n=1 Tax=Gordonibacter pamelaeae TaxID=471189 RepID=UPI0012B15A20|nr:hypothetical protein [Gordonibacter pamelaeae]MCQ4846793.1 hypothetical protein [Gordonibacter pamelaeae]MCQ4849791.1 hypothetical protein [Gordonibacter pamelaeae]MSA62998.1 hypothetical protein [Gordonibacter pamelaeae]
MKLKAAIRYQAVELVQSAAVFCLIVGGIIAAGALFAVVDGAHFVVPGLGFLPFVLMPMLALATFPGDVRFLMQMGLARPQMIASTAASLVASCALLALVEVVCAILVPFWPREQSLFLIAYGPENGPALDFLFMLLGCAAAAGAGLAFAALQMRFGTRRVVLALCVLAMAAILALNVNSYAFVGGVAWLFGFGEGASLANPFLLFAVVTALGVLVAWAAVRRIEVR